MEKKHVRLGAFGVAVFVVLVLFFVSIIPRAPVAVGSQGSALTLWPYFATELQGSGYGPVLSLALLGSSNTRKEVVVSEKGFSMKDFVIAGQGDTSNDLLLSRAVLLNDSSKVRRFLVVSKKADGADYAVRQFVLEPGKRIKLNFVVGPYVSKLVGSGKVSIERTAKGIPLFEIACTLNCEDSASYITVYQKA